MTASRTQELLPEFLDCLDGVNFSIPSGTFTAYRVGQRTLQMRKVDTDGSYDFAPDEFFVTVAVNPADL